MLFLENLDNFEVFFFNKVIFKYYIVSHPNH